MEKQAERFFIGALVITVVIKLMLALAIPITSDEAYFYLWGRYPAPGYYDHPPVIGWILYLLLFLGKSPLLLRLPPILFSTLVGAGIYFVLRRFDRLKAALVAVLFLLSPINLLNVLVTTDTPLLLFSFASCIFLFQAIESRNYLHYLLSGIFLGLAFLSKYFAVLLGVAYFVYFLFSEKNKRKTTGFLVLYAALVPFVAFHVYWNYLHCWPNIMFNLINRNKNEVFSLGKVLVFILCQLYLLTPPVIYYLYKKRDELPARFADRRFTILLYAFLVPLAAFSVLSFKKVIGLHWVLSFYPFMYIALYLL
jgi:4-amino-4-deoxy-L-arabinose transferase-like glycosyltransferase